MFQLEGEAQVWWKWARTSRDLEAMTWARVLFDSSASHSFIAASVVIELGLEVETLEEPLYVSSPLGIRERIGMICRGCELEISGTLLTVDLRIMDMSEFDVIDECIKHSSYTRVGFSFSRLFYSYFIVFVARSLIWCLVWLQVHWSVKSSFWNNEEQARK